MNSYDKFQFKSNTHCKISTDPNPKISPPYKEFGTSSWIKRLYNSNKQQNIQKGKENLQARLIQNSKLEKPFLLTDMIYRKSFNTQNHISTQ